jgi:hypothetical protein
VARGQQLFNSLPINITGVAGINDDVSAGGLMAGGIPSLTGTCGTCHDTPNVGNHSFPTPLDIGTGDPNPSDASANLGGVDISYLPSITVCMKDPQTGLPTSNCKPQPTWLWSMAISTTWAKSKDPSCGDSRHVLPTFTMVPLEPCWTPSSFTKHDSRSP